MERQEQANPLGSEKIARLLWRFAIPSIIAMLVTSLYNIVDQFFIGHSVGELGNAATNISFPLSISCTSLGLLFGIGGASAFNLSMGEGRKDQAVYYLGNAAVMLFGSGAALCIVTQFFLEPLLLFFGSPDNVLGYARTYTRIIAWGFPFLIFSLGGGSEEYYRFAIKYFHIYLFFTFFNFLQPISSTLFTSIGKPKKGMFLSLTRQIFFLLPLLLFFPLLFGIEGVLYAGPVADFAAAVTAAVMIRGEFKRPEYKMQDTRTV